MELKLYNTLTRTKEVFRPLDPTRVRMYVCGPTVYDRAHIGNARPVIVFDVLFRLLRHLYGPDHVTYVRNITDVDDKINARAAERGVPIRELTDETYKWFQEDVAALGCLPPTAEPRATEYIEPMKELIERLVKTGFAYVDKEHVLFEVRKMPDYGKFSHQSLEDMKVSARSEVAPKRDPLDFVLWKPSKADEPGWDSPCGIANKGRPGWHIECSAMSNILLWEKVKASLSSDGLAHPHQFDIHGGGIDLVFPHHENELAQSRCAFGTPLMAQFWMHNGFVQMEGEKMAKSVGNVVTIRELLQKWPSDILRLQMLTTHYRQPIDWTESRTDLARAELEEWGYVLQGYYNLPNDKEPRTLIEQLSDDLNTPNALAVLRDLFLRAKKGGLQERLEFGAACKFLGFRELNRPGLFQFGVSALNVGQQNLFDYSDSVERLRAAIANSAPEALRSALLSSIRQNGLDVEIGKDGSITLVRGDQAQLKTKIERLIAEREAARERKDWAESDRIRDELKNMGMELEDTPDGTKRKIVLHAEPGRFGLKGGDAQMRHVKKGKRGKDT